MTTRALKIKSELTGAPKTLRSIKDIDDALKSTETTAKKVTAAMGAISLPADTAAALKAMSTGLREFMRAAEGAQRNMRDTGSAGKSAFSGVRGSIVAANAAVSLFSKGIDLAQGALSLLKAPVDFAVDFEFGLAKIKAIATEIPEDFGDAMAALAARLPQSQADLLAGAESVARAGLRGDEIVGLMESASKLATAAGSSLEESASLIMVGTNVWKEYGLTSEEVADKLFTATKLGKTSIEELNASLGNSAAVAAQYGTSLDDVLAITTTLAAQGVKTAEGQTIINSLIKGLSAPTAKAAAAFEKYGIVVGASELASTGLIKKLEEIHTAVGQDKDALSGLFGRFEATRGIMGLFSGDLKGLHGNLRSISLASGSVEDAWGSMMGTTKGMMQQLSALKESVLLELGNAVLPLVKKGLSGISEWYEENGESALAGLVDGIERIGVSWDNNSGLIVQGVNDMADAAATLAADTKFLLDALGLIDLAAQDRHNAEVVFAQGMESMHSRAMTRQEEAIAALHTLFKERKKLGDSAEDVAAKAILDHEAEAIGIERKAAITKKLAALDGLHFRASQDFRETERRERGTVSEEHVARLKNEMEGQRAIVEGYAQEIAALKRLRDEIDTVTSASYQRYQLAVDTSLAAIKGWSAAALSGIKTAGEELDKFNKLFEKPKVRRAATKAEIAATKRAAKEAKREAERAAKEVADVKLKAEEELLFSIEDKAARHYQRMLLLQRRALADRVGVMGEGSAEVNALLVKQARVREDFIAAEANKTLRLNVAEINKRIKAEAKAAKEANKIAKADAKEREKITADAKEVMLATSTQFGDDLLNAAVANAIYGDSFVDTINQILQALAIQAGIETIKETALGLASLALGPIGAAPAAAHFASAGVWAGITGAATVGAHVSGGFHRPESESEDSGIDALEGPARNQTGAVTGGATVVNVNFAGTMPLATKEDIGNALTDIMDVTSNSRGRSRADFAKFNRRA